MPQGTGPLEAAAFAATVLGDGTLVEFLAALHGQWVALPGLGAFRGRCAVRAPQHASWKFMHGV